MENGNDMLWLSLFSNGCLCVAALLFWLQARENARRADFWKASADAWRKYLGQCQTELGILRRAQNFKDLAQVPQGD